MTVIARSLAWDVFEDAIFTWVQSGSGFSVDNVWWAGQKISRDGGPWIQLQITGIVTNGIDWTQRSENIGGAAGSEFTDRTQGQRQLTLSVTVFAGIDGSGIGNSAPLAVLNDIVSEARSEDRKILLNLAGIGVGTITDPQSIGATLTASTFEPRAFVEFELHVASELAKESTFVESIITTVTVNR